ncbi:DUF86 domain-containing protein [Thermofilum sp.]|uniref:DUF86 domain-containing protein n=1 Tax=Thermofilum sp. TaxID=1961369 RepID=UPI00258F097A|nr:DUF86 domain-containing protein [Thermofilum sp.]
MGVLKRLLDNLLSYTSLLDGLKPEDLEDEYKYYAALHLLQTQAQVLMDIFARASSTLGLGVDGYIDAGHKLRAKDIINDKDLGLYRRIVGFWNVVVHEYSDVDSSIVLDIITNKKYREVARLATKVVEELEKRGMDC